MIALSLLCLASPPQIAVHEVRSAPNSVLRHDQPVVRLHAELLDKLVVPSPSTTKCNATSEPVVRAVLRVREARRTDPLPPPCMPCARVHPGSGKHHPCEPVEVCVAVGGDAQGRVCVWWRGLRPDANSSNTNVDATAQGFLATVAFWRAGSYQLSVTLTDLCGNRVASGDKRKFFVAPSEATAAISRSAACAANDETNLQGRGEAPISLSLEPCALSFLGEHAHHDAHGGTDALQDCPSRRDQMLLRPAPPPPPMQWAVVSADKSENGSNHAGLGEEELHHVQHRVPRIVHFIWLSSSFGSRPFGLMQYLAVVAAKRMLEPVRVWVHVQHEPQSYWWRRVRTLIEIRTLTRESQPDLLAVLQRRYQFDAIRHVAHKADVLRLLLLLRYGGVYMDLDVITVDAGHFNDFLAPSLPPVVPNSSDKPGMAATMGKEHLRVRSPDVVLAVEGQDGMGNAIILAQPGASFLLRWLSYYDDFGSTGQSMGWSTYSVKLPALLAMRHPTEVFVLPSTQALHHPSWRMSGLRRLFEDNDFDFGCSMAVHLFESKAWDQWGSGLWTMRDVAQGDASVMRLFRQILQAHFRAEVKGHKNRSAQSENDAGTLPEDISDASSSAGSDKRQRHGPCVLHAMYIGPPIKRQAGAATMALRALGQHTCVTLLSNAIHNIDVAGSGCTVDVTQANLPSADDEARSTNVGGLLPTPAVADGTLPDVVILGPGGVLSESQEASLTNLLLPGAPPVIVCGASFDDEGFFFEAGPDRLRALTGGEVTLRPKTPSFEAVLRRLTATAYGVSAGPHTARFLVSYHDSVARALSRNRSLWGTKKGGLAYDRSQLDIDRGLKRAAGHPAILYTHFQRQRTRIRRRSRMKAHTKIQSGWVPTLRDGRGIATAADHVKPSLEAMVKAEMSAHDAASVGVALEREINVGIDAGNSEHTGGHSERIHADDIAEPEQATGLLYRMIEEGSVSALTSGPSLNSVASDANARDPLDAAVVIFVANADDSNSRSDKAAQVASMAVARAAALVGSHGAAIVFVCAVATSGSATPLQPNHTAISQESVQFAVDAMFLHRRRIRAARRRIGGTGAMGAVLAARSPLSPALIVRLQQARGSVLTLSTSLVGSVLSASAELPFLGTAISFEAVDFFDFVGLRRFALTISEEDAAANSDNSSLPGPSWSDHAAPLLEHTVRALTALLPNVGQTCAPPNGNGNTTKIPSCQLLRSDVWFGVVQRCNLALRRALKQHRDAFDPLLRQLIL